MPAPVVDTPALAPVRARLLTLLDELIRHDGYGSMRVDVRLLKRGQKEVIVDCGKQHRFVVDVPSAPSNPDARG
ncbi:hypothetical protein WNB94_10160 [Aquabacterium sp. A3]|uniref:hypothetical protein n=1 Tax=Aquabacterium sp. A3 TaxID=3132829 RepID=UPI003119711C